MKETAYFAMGCFWGPQEMFDKIPGVVETEVGYMGGDDKEFPEPTYEEVCLGNTGHAETVKVIFDSDKTSYGKLLDAFWENHDYTQINMQGPDIGSQYRSVIFYSNEQQKKIAESSKAEKQRNLDKRAGKQKVATEIVSAGKFKFHKAEEYHQHYVKKHGKNVC